jgi:hypothetical protein
MRLTTKVVLAPALTLACVTGLAGPVQARPAKSVIVVDTAWAEGTGVKVDGHVTSPKHACEAGRKVKVYHDVAPRGPGSEDFLLGRTTTESDGSWFLSTPYQPDRVYAKVRRSDGCRSDTSPTEGVDDL